MAPDLFDANHHSLNIASTTTYISRLDPLHKIFRYILERLPQSARGHIVAIIGELTGTTLFLFFGFAGTQVANISSNPNAGSTVITTVVQKTPQQLLYISLAFGFSLAVNAWTYFRISGGLFNPAVSICSTPMRTKH